MYFANQNFMYIFSKEYLKFMEFWQGIFLHLAIIGFISQVLHVLIIFLKSAAKSKKVNDKFFLEKIYNKPSFSSDYIKKARF